MKYHECNQCGKRELFDEYGRIPAGWYTLGRRAPELGTTRPEQHACSSHCLLQLAVSEQVQITADRLSGDPVTVEVPF